MTDLEPDKHQTMKKPYTYTFNFVILAIYYGREIAIVMLQNSI